MKRPLLRARLRRRIERELDCENDSRCDSVLGSDAIADRVLDRLSADHGSGGLLDLLQSIDWVKLLEVILAVVSLFGEVPPQGACETGESQPGQGSPADQLRQAESD